MRVSLSKVINEGCGLAISSEPCVLLKAAPCCGRSHGRGGAGAFNGLSSKLLWHIGAIEWYIRFQYFTKFCTIVAAGEVKKQNHRVVFWEVLEYHSIYNTDVRKTPKRATYIYCLTILKNRSATMTTS